MEFAPVVEQLEQERRRIEALNDSVQFLEQVVQCLVGNKGQNIEKSYLFLKERQDKINGQLLEIFPDRVNRWLENAELQLPFRLAVIDGFGNLIQYFPGGGRELNLELAITAYQIVLEKSQKLVPKQWAATHNNLSTAYSVRIKGDHSENLEQSVQCCEQALNVFTFTSSPNEWAMTQNNLGSAYRQRVRGKSDNNLEKAIKAFHSALQVHTRDAMPQDWAMTKHNLGLTYADSRLGRSSDNIELAIDAFHSALKVYTP